MDKRLFTVVGTGMSEYKLIGFEKYISENDYIALDTNYLKHNKAALFEGKELITNNKSFNEIKIRIKEILSKDKRANIVYFVTGSPTFYSGGISTARWILNEVAGLGLKDIKVVNNVSTRDYIQSRLLINENELETISLHGRKEIELSKIFKKRYTLVLADKDTLSRLKELLISLDKADYKLTLCSKLGYAGTELIYAIEDIDEYALNAGSYMPYSVVLEKLFLDYEKQNDSYKEEFAKDSGMITKRDTRHMLLSLLELKEEQILWDIGAATGSIGISAYIKHKVKALFFEKDQKRVNDIKENMRRHKVLGGRVIQGDAIEGVENEAGKADRILIGGGGQEVSKNILNLYERLNEGGILVGIYVNLDSFLSTFKILKESKLEFMTTAFSYTNYIEKKVHLATPQRLSFLIKIKKESEKKGI